ncbi:MAG: hypothetical protein JNL67_00970 [Planctomycetaceae bacterium]|nr:hypothetical protein [Planctomycetaceae bacterium]
MANPYSTPHVSSRPIDPASRVQAPAIALIVVASIASSIVTLGLIADVFVMVTGRLELVQEAGEDLEVVYTDIVIRIVWGVVLLVASLFVLFGAVQMKRLKNYRMAMAASIVAIIPLVGPCCILGIPFGIWSVIRLTQPGVRQLFS